MRRRWVQPTGSVELNVKTPDLAGSAWTGGSTADFTDVDVAALAADAAPRLDWGARRVTLPAGRYETLLPAVGGRRTSCSCSPGRWTGGRRRRAAARSPARTARGSASG